MLPHVLFFEIFLVSLQHKRPPSQNDTYLTSEWCFEKETWVWKMRWKIKKKAKITELPTFLGKIVKSASTVWKFQDFSVSQILCEIIFGVSRSSKSAIFTIFWSLNFVILVNFNLQKLQKFIKNPNSEPLNVLKWLILHF